MPRGWGAAGGAAPRSWSSAASSAVLVGERGTVGVSLSLPLFCTLPLLGTESNSVIFFYQYPNFLLLLIRRTACS